MKKLKKPEILLDAEGYPTDEYLNFLMEYVPSDDFPVLDFVRIIKGSGWWHGGILVRIGRKYRGVAKVELRTGGWSGNDDVILAILGNRMLTVIHMRYMAWKTGGHYFFEVKL